MHRKFLLTLVMLLCLLSVFTTITAQNFTKKEYGLFTAIDSSKIEKLLDYKLVIIDVNYFSRDDINYLHKNGVKVYSYLNIGSLENFRPYYYDYNQLILKDYENWSEEGWIDISNKSWQEFIINDLGKTFYEKNIDGFFIDNVDIYALFPEDDIFEGIYSILYNLKNKYNKEIMINNGYSFLNKAITSNINVSNLIDSVNQEEVYTIIKNYEKNIFSINPKKERKFIINHLKTLKAQGLDIYITEYMNRPRINNKINNYYSNLDFKCYISDSITLD